MTDLQQLAARAPALHEAYDAARAEYSTYADEVQAWFDNQDLSYAELDALALDEVEPADALGLRLAIKLAESRRVIRELSEPLTVTLLNPVYKETGRMQRRDQHPHGEDSIRFKVEALQGLEQLNDQLRARLLVIDDECPEGSGEMARAILAEYPDALDSGHYQVLSLRDAIDQQDEHLPPGLTHKDGPRRSVKGGAVLYGMRKTLAEDIAGRHILIDNDADLSIHPAQIGLLIDDIVNRGFGAVAGSRREEDSVATIGGSRNVRGRLFIEIWQHFLPQLAERIKDTNRAFKAFDSTALRQIIDDIQTYTFPYQIEVLQACISRDIPLARRGIGYLDSEAASTQQGENITETYLNQIHQIIAIARHYRTIPEDDALMAYFGSISEDRWMQIEQDPPAHIHDLI